MQIKRRSNSKNRLFASIFDFADALRAAYLTLASRERLPLTDPSERIVHGIHGDCLSRTFFCAEAAADAKILIFQHRSSHGVEFIIRHRVRIDSVKIVYSGSNAPIARIQIQFADGDLL